MIEHLEVTVDFYVFAPDGKPTTDEIERALIGAIGDQGYPVDLANGGMAHISVAKVRWVEGE